MSSQKTEALTMGTSRSGSAGRREVGQGRAGRGSGLVLDLDKHFQTGISGKAHTANCPQIMISGVQN